MAALVGALQLDDDEAAASVEGKKVDTPVGILPLAELLGDDEQVVAITPMSCRTSPASAIS